MDMYVTLMSRRYMAKTLPADHHDDQVLARAIESDHLLRSHVFRRLCQPP